MGEQTIIQIDAYTVIAGIFTLSTMLVVLAWKGNGRISSIETKIEGDRTLNKNRFDQIDKKFDKIDTRFTQMDKRLDQFEDRVFKIVSDRSQITQTMSPVQITEAGYKLIKPINLEEYVQSLESQLCKEGGIDCTTMNAYEIQKAAFDIMQRHEYTEEMEDKMQITAYEDGISMATMQHLAGIILRDLCLKKCNMDHKEVDKFKDNK